VIVLEAQLVLDLIKVLDQEAKAYDDILKISKNKTSIIVEGKVAELESLVKIEQTLVLQMSRIETMRENLVDKISAQLNIKSKEVTISELLQHIKGEEADKLKACQANMSKALNDLKYTNEVNSKLIKNSLDFINFSINLMSSVDLGTNNYGTGGQTNETKKRTFFDMKL
jgi:hypothetical protein